MRFHGQLESLVKRMDELYSTQQAKVSRDHHCGPLILDGPAMAPRWPRDGPIAAP